KIQNEETDIFEKGGTDSAAQTGEEYRQELRNALHSNRKEDIVELPWKAGSGMVKGNRTGHFFCAKVGDRVFLRFVPKGATQKDELIEEMGTCLRLIECTEETERAVSDSTLESAYAAWDLARENIFSYWDFYTDSKNLQPKVRPLNLRVDEFLMDNPPADIEQTKLDRVSNTLTCPWPRREENKLREIWKEEHGSSQEKSLALIQAIEETGIEPFEQPERFPKIDGDEVRLVCWLEIQAEEARI
ncbi:MAG: helicase, partial [Planctomycetota bacterium]|nr:helicase [Planctomycetota bacterium]